MIVKSFSISYEKLFSTYKINLLYGENFHLKNEIVEKLSIIFKKNNYKTKFIKQEDLIKDIEILDNYINQDNLFGDKEILIIKEATDKLLDYLNINDFDKKIIIISNNLPKSSKLRNIAEKKETISCIPCYDDDEKTLKNILKQGINLLGLKTNNETIDQLFDLNKLNRNDVNSALEKLKLIAKEKRLDSEMLSSLFNTTSSYDAFQISNALLTSNKQELNKIFSSFYYFSFNFNEVIGPLKYKINKLISIYEYDLTEKNISKLIEKYKPPVFWKEKSIVQIQMSKWAKDELILLLEKINQIEIMCKTNYEISETIFNKFMLDIITKKVLVNTYFSH
tara:strand:+ start:2897 stop:3907 length:1011 start_codon:yes stop_codon:yes gene_type:complete